MGGIAVTALALVFALGVSQPASAQTPPNGDLFNCNVIYTGDAIGTGIYSFDPAVVNPPTNSATYVTWSPLQGSAATNPTYLAGSAGDDTLALGPQLDASGNIMTKLNGDPMLRLYNWSWSWSSDGGTTGAFRIRYLDDTAGATWTWLDPANASVVTDGPASTEFWSGGEVNQMTGELYLAGGLVGLGTAPACPTYNINGTNTLIVNNTGLTARMGCNFRLGILNPATGAFRHSGQMVPASSTDNVAANFWPVSDMAIDAQGNAYVIASNGAANPWYLLRMVPQDTSGGWKFNIVTSLDNYGNNNPLAGGAKVAWPGNPDAFFSMNFLNGKLYIGYGGANVYVCDPLGGTCQIYGNPYGGVYRDFAACQVAPVITGTVYNDVYGTGAVDRSSFGYTGLKVSIYKDDGTGNIVYKGSQLTNGSGTYSFIVDSINATYYVRLEQPSYANGINAQQTWASAGGDKNVTSAFCVDETNPTFPTAEIHSSKGTDQDYFLCGGTKLFGADPAGPTVANTPWDIKQAQFYSKVVMTTDREVAYADFGISLISSFGDAAATVLGSSTSTNFLTMLSAGGPVHNISLRRMWLGDRLPAPPYPQEGDGVSDPNSDAHPSDDGVTVTIAGIEMPLQNAVLANGRTDYKVKVKVNGPYSSRGYLSVWDNMATTYPVTSRFTNLQDATGSGEILINNYKTITTTSPTTPYVVRFRFSSTPSLPAQTNAANIGGGEQAIGSTSITAPWVVDGEVEDYQVYSTTSIVRVAAISLGGVGTFNYTFGGDVWGSAPSSATGTVTTVTPGVQANEASGAIHAANHYTSPQPISITQNALPNAKWSFVSMSCADSVTGAPIVPTSGSGSGPYLLPAAGLGGDVICVFTNKYTSADPAQSTLVITPTGPILTTASYTATVTANDSAGVPQPDVEIVLTPATGTTLTGAGTGSFNAATGICTTNASGVCTVTWTSATAGTFALAATVDGTPLGNCASSASTCSPQNRTFVIPYDAGHSTLTASPTSVTANGTDASTLTVTLKDSNDVTTTSVGTTTVSFTGNAPGTFSATSCTIPEGSSSCNITITSTKTGTANVSATIGGTATTPASVAVTFTPGPINLDHSTLTASPSTVAANGTSTSTVTMTLMDAYDNPVTTATLVTFSVPSAADGSLNPLTCTTNTTTGACSVTYTSPATINAAQKATVTATIAAGSKTVDITLTDSGVREIQITKTVNAAGGYITGGKFDITVKCGSAAAETLHLASGDTQSVFGQTGDTCTISEAAPAVGTAIMGGYTNKATYPESIILSSDPAMRPIEVVNTITMTSGSGDTSVLSVHKDVTGAVAYDTPDALFTINVTCVGDSDVKSVTLKKGEIGHVDVATGAKCTISEPTKPTPTNLAYQYIPNFRPSTTTVSDDADVYVDNFISGTALFAVNVTNAVTGDATAAGYTAGGSFTVALNCGASYTFTDSMPEGDTYTYNVPNNSNCTLTTSAWPSLTSSNYSWVDSDDLVNPVTGIKNVTVTHNIKANPMAVYSTLVVTPAGPIYTTNSYTVTVTANDSSTPAVPQPNVPIVITVSSGGTLTGTSTGSFDSATGTCTTGAAGTCVVTWTRTSAATDTVNATMGGSNVGNCASSATTCSPQTRQFVMPPDAGHSTLATDTTTVTANGTDHATLTVTLYDVNGSPTISVGTTTVSFTNSGVGTLSASTCTVPDGGNSCNVTISSGATGSATVSATIGGASTTPPSVTITFTNSGISTTYSTLTASPTTLVANGTSTSTVTIVLRDSNNLIYTTPTLVTFSVPSAADGSLSPLNCTTSATTGACSVTYTSPAVLNAAQKATVTASITGSGILTTDITLTDGGNREIVVTKKVTSAAGGYSNGKFTIIVDCTGASGNSSKTMTLADTESDSLVAHSGDNCTMSETVPTGVVASGFTNEATYPSSLVLGTENPRNIEVDNVISPGTTTTYVLTVSKTVTDTTPSNDDPNAMFNISVTCDPDPTGASVKNVTLKKGEKAHVEVAKDAACTIDEAAATALNGDKYMPNITPSSIAKVGADQSVVVNNVVTNLSSWSTVDVKNTVSGDPDNSVVTSAGYVTGGQFAVTLNCGASDTYTYNMVEGNTYMYNVPVNASCTLTTGTATLPTLNTGYSWSAHNSTPSSPFTAVAAGVTATEDHVIKADTAAATSTLVIDKAGPVGDSTDYTTNNSYTVTVTANDQSSPPVPQPNAVIVISVTGGGTLTSAGTGTFNAATGECTTSAAGTCVVTWTSATAGTFEVHATLGGTEVGNCASSASTCSPQSRTFYGLTDCGLSTVAANPASLDANGTSTSTITVTLKDANGTPVLAPTSVPLSVDYGTLSASSCTTSATTGSCTVTYTSPSATPPGGAATVSATMPCGNKTASITLGNSPNQTVTVHKAVSGSGYVAGATFAITVNCGAGYTQTFNLANGGTDSMSVPIGAVCNVSETNPGATVIGSNTNMASIAPSTFTVLAGVDETVEVQNDITSGSVPKGLMTVSKNIGGDANYVQDGHIATNEFTISVTCTGVAAKTFQLKGGQSATVEGPLGQKCTINEPSEPAANAGYKYVPSYDPMVIAKLPTTRSVTVTNTVVPDDGTPYYQVTLTNAVVGDSSLYNNNGTFTLNLRCGTFDKSPMLAVGDVAGYSVAGGVGASCTVDTSAWPQIIDPNYVWYSDTYNPTSPFPVTAAVDEVATHTLATATTRTLTVTKTVSGPAKTGGYVPNASFAISVQCGAAAAKQLLLADGGIDNTITAKVGDLCTVSEADPSTSVVRSGYTNTALIYPSSFTVAEDTAINVTNRIENGTLAKKTVTVTKTVADTYSAAVAGDTFEIDVNCTGTTAAVFKLQDGWTGTVEAQAGQACTITEPTTPSIAGGAYKYVATSINPSTTTLPSAGSTRTGIAVNVTNTVAPYNATFYPVNLSNAVTGDPTPSAYSADSPFVLSMNCGTNYNWASISMYFGDTAQYQVPASSNCTMGTVDRPTITNVNYKWDNTTGTLYNPASPFPVNATVNETATHTIVPATMRDITIIKAVTNGTGSQLTTPFTIHVNCGSGVQNFSLADGGSQVVQALDNSVCTITEDSTTAVGADGYTAMIEPSQFTVNGNRTVNVTNRIESGKPSIQKANVTVTKKVNGATAQSDPSALFEIDVACNGTTLATFHLMAGDSGSVEGTVGQNCTITEPNLATMTPQPSGGYTYASSIMPSSSSLPSTGLPVTVTNTVTNVTMRQVTLTNAVIGDQTPSVYNTAQPFVLTLNCGASTIYDFGQISMIGTATSTVSVPNNSTCAVNTVTLPTITNALYGWYGNTYTPATSFTVTANQAATVTHALRLVGTQNVIVHKTVTGSTTTAPFSIHLSCAGGAYTQNAMLANGESSTALAVPVGAYCTVTEDNPGSSIIGAGNSNTAVIAPSGFTVINGADEDVYVTNRITAGTISKGTLTVTKTIAGNTAAHDPANVFGIEVNCATTPVANFNLLENQTATVEGELGQECTITEPTIPPTTVPATYRYVANISPSKTTLQDDQPVTVENAVVTGNYSTLTLTNAVANDPSPSVYDHTGNFTLALTCGSDAWTPDMHTGDESTFNVPTGTQCSLSTTAWPTITDSNYAWFSDTYSPTSPFTVSTTMTETATHTIRLATTRTITVTKTVTNGSGSALTTPFSIHVVCTQGATTVTNATLSLANGQSDKAYAPDGAVCAVTEDNNATAAGAGNSYTALIYPAGFTVNGDQAVTVENRIESGMGGMSKATLKVSKVVGEMVAGYKAAGHDPNALFTITVDCANTTNASFKLMDGQYATVEGEVGQTCVIDEPTEPAALTTSYQYVPSITLNSLTLSSTGSAVTVKNDVASSATTYHRVYLVNQVVGSYPAQFDPNGMFVLRLTCGTAIDQTTPSMPAGTSVFYSAPDNTSCDVQVVSRPNANSGYTWAGETLDLSTPFVNGVLPFTTQPSDETATVYHDLEAAGTVAVTIDSALAGDPSLYSSGDYEVTVTCGTFSKTVTFTPDGSEVVWVPEGTTCTVTENSSGVTLSGGTTRRTIVPHRFTSPTAGNTMTVTVENRLLQGLVSLAELTVDKIVTGVTPAAGYNPATTFDITVQSTTQASKTLTIIGGQTALTDVPIGDTVDIDEPSVPSGLAFGYMYAPTISPSQIASMPSAGREVYVTNMITALGTMYQVTFGQATVNNTAGSGYVSGSGVPLNTTVTCGSVGYFLPLAEGDTATASIPAGAACTTAVPGTLPTLNSGYYWDGPTTTPAFSAGSPFAVTANGAIIIAYGAGLRNPPPANEPIPTLDPKALLLLMGLLTGVVFWRSRRQRQG